MDNCRLPGCAAFTALQAAAWIHVRHDEAAVFAAGAEAQPTEELAVCAGSCGPGNLHLMNGLSEPARTADACREAFTHPGPALVELITDPQALPLAPKIKDGQVFGFATAMSKIVLNKGAGEAVGMARSNLRNIPRS